MPLWDRAGVDRAPAVVVPAEADALAERRHTSMEGMGRSGRGTLEKVSTAAPSSCDGFARLPTRRRPPRATSARTATTVRVMPFLEGIPCSIHGIVFDEHVAAIRPVEMVTLRRPPGHPEGAFFYAGCSTFFDPPDATRASMREIARTTGALLRAEVGFRGAFTIDGVATARGFLPTELNPRSGAGLNVMLRGLADFPLQQLLDALVGGIALAYDPHELERDLVAAADATRGGGTWRTFLDRPMNAIEGRHLAYDGASWHQVSENDADGRAGVRAGIDADGGRAVVAVGEGPSGSFVRAVFDSDGIPKGESVGHRAVDFWRYADGELGTEIGSLTPAMPA